MKQSDFLRLHGSLTLAQIYLSKMIFVCSLCHFHFEIFIFYRFFFYFGSLFFSYLLRLFLVSVYGTQFLQLAVLVMMAHTSKAICIFHSIHYMFFVCGFLPFLFVWISFSRFYIYFLFFSSHFHFAQCTMHVSSSSSSLFSPVMKISKYLFVLFYIYSFYYSKFFLYVLRCGGSILFVLCCECV